MTENTKPDLKSLFSYARSKSRTKHSVAPIMDGNGDITTYDCEKAVILNAFFSSVFGKENINSISHPELVFTGYAKERLLYVYVSQRIAEMKLNKLNMNKASGVDGIHPSLLRELTEQLSGPLSILFRRTLDEGMVPTDWRAANVTPLYKKRIQVLLVIIDQ